MFRTIDDDGREELTKGLFRVCSIPKGRVWKNVPGKRRLLEKSRRRRQIRDEQLHLALPVSRGLLTEDRRWMHRRERGRAEPRGDWSAARDRHAKVAAQQRLCGRRSEAHDQLGLDQLDLLLEPGQAGSYLASCRLLVEAPLPLCDPFEVLDDVRDVRVAARDLGRGERLVEQSSRRPDEGLASLVFLVARLLAYQHHPRRSSA